MMTKSEQFKEKLDHLFTYPTCSTSGTIVPDLNILKHRVIAIAESLLFVDEKK